MKLENNNEFTSDFTRNILKGIGGKDNIEVLNNCITRLRLILCDVSLVNKDLLINETGATNVIIKGNDVHIVYGIKVDKVREALDNELESLNSGNEVPKKILEGIGGKDNINTIDNCITRLRLTLKDKNKVNKELLIRETNAANVIESGDEIHIVYGVKIAEIRSALDKELANG